MLAAAAAAAAETRLRRRDRGAVAERVVVAVKVERAIAKDALAWALTHVVHAGDCVTLLAVFAGEKSGRRFWNFPMLTGDCGSNFRDNLPDRICQISETCSQMVFQFRNEEEVKVRVKVISGTPGNAVAAEASRSRASWVILDKKLKQELKQCMEELRCNVVVMRGSQAKVLRLNLQSSNDIETPYFSAVSSPKRDTIELQEEKVKHCTPVSSPEEPTTPRSRTTTQGDSQSSSDTNQSLNFYEHNPLFEGVSKGNYTSEDNLHRLDDQLLSLISHGKKKFSTMSNSPTSSAANNSRNVFWIPQNHMVEEKPIVAHTLSKKNRTAFSSLLDKFVQYDIDTKPGQGRLDYNQNHVEDFDAKSNNNLAVFSGRTTSTPPPLCSSCQNKAPLFGKPPKRFSYEELVAATNGFSDINLLAEGGFGIVYRGALKDGQVVAVKLLKFAGSQADTDFCREVRVLSCAQHRNVVLLIGFCADGNKRILVYEYICNGSLDFHLHGNDQKPLDLDCRLKIAIGTARGLRYLHEDCRVGCIVHRDMRPHNILLTHDFEPLVADFGLARWRSECIAGSEERVIGTSGYIAPEYIDGGAISQKVDVYSFGLVILELLTGRRASELHHLREHNMLHNILTGRQYSFIEPNQNPANLYQFIDPHLVSDRIQSFNHHVERMGFAASLCLTRDPDSRPSMSKVLRILEGGYMSFPLSFDLNSAGNRSGRLLGLSSNTKPDSRSSHSRQLSH